jgi:hypothetical protein
MTALAKLIEELRPAKARNKSEFVSYGLDELDVDVLAERYREIQSLAPGRHDRNLSYLFRRSGVSTAGVPSNRNEEHLAMALYRAFQRPEAMYLPGGRKIEILDYQVPLKAQQCDGSVGKIDLLGLVNGKRLAVLELKWKGGDAPLFAILEAVVYSAILKANLPAIASELTAATYDASGIDGVDVMVLGKANYWQEFDSYDADWLRRLEPKLNAISGALSLSVQLIQLEDAFQEKASGNFLEIENFKAMPLYSSQFPTA